MLRTQYGNTNNWTRVIYSFIGLDSNHQVTTYDERIAGIKSMASESNRNFQFINIFQFCKKKIDK